MAESLTPLDAAVIAACTAALEVVGHAQSVQPEIGAIPRGTGLTVEKLRRARALLEAHAASEPELFVPVLSVAEAARLVVSSYVPLDDLVEATRDTSRGALLCEMCFDAMTDQVLPAERSETGGEMACCAACWPQR